MVHYFYLFCICIFSFNEKIYCNNDSKEKIESIEEIEEYILIKNIINYILITIFFITSFIIIYYIYITFLIKKKQPDILHYDEEKISEEEEEEDDEEEFSFTIPGLQKTIPLDTTDHIFRRYYSESDFETAEKEELKLLEREEVNFQKLLVSD